MIQTLFKGKAPHLVPAEDWRLRGACRTEDADLFFTIDTGRPDPMIDFAKQICEGCPVKDLCLAYYMANPDEHAIAGATTPKERGAYVQAGAHAARQREVWRSKRKPCVGCGEPCGMESTYCGQCHAARARVALIAQTQARNVARTAEARALYSEGLTDHQISERMGITVRTIRKYLREALSDKQIAN